MWLFNRHFASLSTKQLKAVDGLLSKTIPPLRTKYLAARDIAMAAVDRDAAMEKLEPERQYLWDLIDAYVSVGVELKKRGVICRSQLHC